MANNSRKGAAEANRISDSLRDALLELNTTHIEEGAMYQKRYFSNESRTKIDVLFALGISNGVGTSCYKIISEAGEILVWSIVDQLPDVSEVLNGQLIVYCDASREQNYIVYIKAGNRIVEPIEFPMIVHCTEDNRIYYVSPYTCIDIYEHLENSCDIEDRISSLEKAVKEILSGTTTTPTPTPDPEPEPEPEPEVTTTTTTTPTPDPEPEDPEPEEPEPEEPEVTTTTTTTPKPVPADPLKIVSFVMDCEENYEVGDVVNPTFVWGYNIEVEAQSINGEDLELDIRTKSYEGVSSSETFTLSATAGGKTVTAMKSITFSEISFMGGGRTKAENVTADNFYEVFSAENVENGFTSEMCVPGSTITKTFSFDAKNYVLMAFPKEVADRLVIKDLNDFDVTCVTKEVTVVNQFGEEITYVVYQSPTATTEVTFVFKF